MSLKFRINKHITIDTLLTGAIAPGAYVHCHNDEYNYLKIFSLNSDLDEQLITETYNRYSNIGFFIEDMDTDDIVVACYDENEDLKYKSLLHMSKDEFWNFPYRPASVSYTQESVDRNKVELVDYKASYLTDFYYRAYKFFRSEGMSFSASKEKADTLVKNIFNDYPKEWGIGYYGNDYDERKEVENVFSILDTKLDFIKNYHYISTQQILNDLESYLFYENNQINSYVKAYFLSDELRLISKDANFNSISNWNESKMVNSNNTGGTIQVLNRNNEKSLSIEFESNRGEDEPLSIISLEQKVDISNENKEALFFKVDIEKIQGLEEKGPLPECSGVAGVSLIYLDDNNNAKGTTIIANMTDSMATDLESGSIVGLFCLNGLTLKNSETLNVIRVEEGDNKKFVLKLSDEVQKISNIDSIYDIKSVIIVLFTSDFFTVDKCYHWTGVEISSPSCSNAKAFLEVNSAGIYSTL